LSDKPTITWLEGEQSHSALWHSENRLLPPKKIVLADDTIPADDAYRLACEGTALLWRGDFQNARQLLQAIARRIDRPRKKKRVSKKNAQEKPTDTFSSTITNDVFNLHRLAQSQRARTLGLILIRVDQNHQIALRRAPLVAEACHEAFGEINESYLVSLRELLGLVGAHEWRKKGAVIKALDTNGTQRIYPHYGVFSPIRGEYLELVANAALPKALNFNATAFDIGTGTGVLAAILAKRGIEKIIATEIDARALICAQENLLQLGLSEQVTVAEYDLFPPSKAALIVCNPPWIPARPSSALERAIYDPDSQMLRGFINGLAAHLETNGEGWLILSDMAEHLGLRSQAELMTWIANAGLVVLKKESIKPHHPKVNDTTDALHAARSAEITSLWRLGILNKP
jgi:tRNA1(Val) A37 N6-methylase TrmN6